MFAFDTLKLARDLREQAEGLAAAISSAVQDNVPAKSEMATEFASIRSEITVLRTDMKMEFAAIRADASASQKDTRSELAAIRSEMTLLEQRMTIGGRHGEGASKGSAPIQLDQLSKAIEGKDDERTCQPPVADEERAQGSLLSSVADPGRCASDANISFTASAAVATLG